MWLSYFTVSSEVHTHTSCDLQYVPLCENRGGSDEGRHAHTCLEASHPSLLPEWGQHNTYVVCVMHALAHTQTRTHMRTQSCSHTDLKVMDIIPMEQGKYTCPGVNEADATGRLPTSSNSIYLTLKRKLRNSITIQ